MKSTQFFLLKMSLFFVMKSLITELQIRRGNEDNSKIIFEISYFSKNTYVVTPHLNHLDKRVQIMGHKICFHEEIV